MLQGGFPFWGPVRYDPRRRVLAVPGAVRLRYTTDGTFPVPLRPGPGALAHRGDHQGDTLSVAEASPAPGAPLRVVPVVVREDGKEALGDVYEVPPEGPSGVGGPLVVPPLAAVEDLSREE